jgi:Protein of unknown function (DUF3147)
MIVRVKLSALKQDKPTEYMVRFGLGGLTTVIAGLLADWWGPEAGGLMLAFPAIFCASATLIESHERKRKSAKGLHGEKRGRGAAALDAAGAGLGSFGLVAFGFACWGLAEKSLLLSLGPRIADLADGRHRLVAAAA